MSIPPPLDKMFSTYYFFLDFLYAIKIPMNIHWVYILLLLQFVLGAALFLLD